MAANENEYRWALGEEDVLHEPVPGNERIDVYLSGGGFRAALGALGAIFYLREEGRWPDVRRIVSVSGGCLVNVRLALARPSVEQLGEFVRSEFDRLTSKRETFSILAPALLTLSIVTLAVTVVAFLWAGWLWSGVALILTVGLGVWPTVRWALRRLNRSFAGRETLGCLHGVAWKVEHVFVATDLTEHGSAFFVANGLRSCLCSSRHGIADGSEILLSTALRASTAFPPLLPPVRVKAGAFEPIEVPLGEPSFPATRSIWLADGGLTGNLGVQLDGDLTPDNEALLDLIQSNVAAGSPVVTSEETRCPHHDDALAWACRWCETRRLVVDSSGSSPRTGRFLGALLRVPGVAQFALALRCLQVMYESSLIDDQHLSDEALVAVVRSESVVARNARASVPLSQSRNLRARQVAAGAHFARRSALSEEWIRHRLIANEAGWITQLECACIAACDEAASVKTGLTAVERSQAARVVASGYLNTLLATRGPDALSQADAGLRRLAQLLGDASDLLDWWTRISTAAQP